MIHMGSTPGELPAELRFIFGQHRTYGEQVKQFLARGKRLSLTTLVKTPQAILDAVHAISVYSQENYIITWLPGLLRDKHWPTITAADHARAKKDGVDLDAAIHTIANGHTRFKTLTIVEDAGVLTTAEDEQLVRELNELMYPLTVEYAMFRLVADNAHERTAIAQNILKALLFIGPIAHGLEHFAAGIGKVFAASADDLLGESAEIMALRGSGFSWRTLIKRARILVPVFALATWGAFEVHNLIETGHLVAGGLLFGFSAVALSLTTAVQSIFLYRHHLEILRQEKKTLVTPGKALTLLALRQDFTNPARLGLFIGAMCAPIMGVLGALVGVMSNGWALAAIGSTESIVAGLTVIFASRINEWRFDRRLERRIA